LSSWSNLGNLTYKEGIKSLAAAFAKAHAINVLPTPVGPVIMMFLCLLTQSFCASSIRKLFCNPLAEEKSISSIEALVYLSFAFKRICLNCLFLLNDISLSSKSSSLSSKLSSSNVELLCSFKALAAAKEL